jgi:hypothetical protein
VPLALLALVLGTLQIFASVALRSRAQPGAWVTFVSAGAAAGLATLGDALPLPQGLRLAFAREAFDTGDLARAAADVARLPPSPDAFALRAALARARGDADTAVRDDLAAGDFALLASDLDTLVARGELVRALATQREAVARLAADRTAPDALAEAEYHLGIFEEARSQTFSRSSERRTYEEAAAAAYARALALAPLDDRSLLAAANQALNLGAWADAAATFERARALDPASPDPLAGLGDLAFRRGDVATARKYLARARALDASSAAVVRLAAKLGT